jgi:hypothetical protein
MENLLQVVQEIETTGETSVPPLNNIKQHYRVIKDPSNDFCKEGSCQKYQMIFLVKSFAGNFAQRKVIRKTWGGQTNLNIKTIFVVSRLGDVEEYLEVESKRHKDILQFDLLDSYENLVYKTIFTMLWLEKHPINTHFLHFIDDDRIVNTKNVYNFSLSSISSSGMEMIGYKVIFGTPYRDSSSKWYISLDQYPFDFWPPYLIGGTILTNIEVVKKIAKSFSYTRIIPIEDAFIGIIAKLLNINVIHHSGFLPHFQPASKLTDKLSSPGYNSYHGQLEGWKQINSK